MRLLALFVALLSGSLVTVVFGQDLRDRIADLAHTGDIAATRALVDANGGPNSDAGGTALLHSVLRSRRPLVENLLEAGADPNFQNRDGFLSLLLAIGNRDERTVAALLRHGADPNRIGRCLESRCSKHPALVYAAYSAEQGIVKQLLDAGADVKWSGYRAAFYANRNHDAETLRLLRAAGGREDVATSETPAKTSSIQGVSALGLTELLPSAEGAATNPAPGSTCRIAVVADEKLNSIADLLTVQLSRNPALTVVDRSDLDRILAEQKLTRSLAGDPAQVAKVGALLGADALLLLQNRTIGTVSIVQTRFVRVHPGLMLDTTSAPDPIPSLEEWIAGMARRVAPLAEKALAPNAVALSIVGMRSSVGTATSRDLESAFTLLLTDRLVREPRIHVLERTAIDELGREHAFGSAGEFWAGSWLLNGTVEPAPDSSGLLTLSLELRPGRGGEPVLVKVRGSKSQLPDLAGETAAQIARALIKQPVAPAIDLGAEAARYLEEAKSAMNCHLYLTAHHAAETAWLLGLRTFETARLRVLSGVRAVQWQWTQMRGRDFMNDEPVRGRVWTADWMNQQLAGQAWVSQRDFIELALRNVSAWREGAARLVEATPAEAADYFKLIEDIAEGAAITFTIFDTAAGELDFGSHLTDLATGIRELLDEAVAVAAERKDVGQASNIAAVVRTTLARFLYPDQAALTTVLREELGKHFAERDCATRARIRELLAFSGTSYQLRVFSFEEHQSGLSIDLRMPAGNAVRDGLLELLNASAAPEDLFLAQFLALRAEAVPEKRREGSRRLLALLWEMRDFLAREDGAAEPYLSQMMALASTPDAKEFALVPSPEDPSLLTHTPELHSLRVRMTRYLTDHLPLDAKASAFLPFITNTTPEEDVELAKARADRLQRRIAAGLSKAPGTAARRGEMRAREIPSTVPPLRITRLWIPSVAGLNDDDLIKVRIETLTVEDDHLWIYGDFVERRGQTALRGYLFRVELPSLATTVHPMPAAASTRATVASQTEVYLVVTPDRIFCGREERDFSIFDRRSLTWTVNGEIKPIGKLMWLGDHGLQLSRVNGVDTVLRIDPARSSAEVLASTQRNPPQTPADDPALQYHVLLFRSKDEIELVARERAASYGRGDTLLPPSQIKVANFSYSPATGTWTTKTPLHQGSAMEVFTAYANWFPLPMLEKRTLKLFHVRDRQPTTFPAVFEPLPEAERLGMLPQLGFSMERYVLSGHGYFLAPSWAHGFWFLPIADLDDYLTAHLPAGAPLPLPPPQP